MSTKRYTEEVEVVGHVMHEGCRVVDVAARLGVGQHSLYQWMKERRVPPAERQALATQS
jgi:transposase